jgi:hypothetical protein
MVAEPSGVSFEAFRDEWLADVIAESPSTTELGRRFAIKIVTQWLDSHEPGTDLWGCVMPRLTVQVAESQVAGGFGVPRF